MVDGWKWKVERSKETSVADGVQSTDEDLRMRCL